MSGASQHDAKAPRIGYHLNRMTKIHATPAARQRRHLALSPLVTGKVGAGKRVNFGQKITLDGVRMVWVDFFVGASEHDEFNVLVAGAPHKKLVGRTQAPIGFRRDRRALEISSTRFAGALERRFRSAPAPPDFPRCAMSS